MSYILSDLKRSRKSNQMLSNTILMSTENVKFYQPGPTFPGSIGKSIYRGYIPKNLVPSVRAHEEPGPKCPGSIGSLSTEFTFLRTWSQVSGLTESLVPSVLARLGSRSTKGTFLRTWSQVSWLTESLVPSVLARLGSFSTKDELANKEPGPKRPRLKARTYSLPR